MQSSSPKNIVLRTVNSHPMTDSPFSLSESHGVKEPVYNAGQGGIWGAFISLTIEHLEIDRCSRYELVSCYHMPVSVPAGVGARCISYSGKGPEAVGNFGNRPFTSFGRVLLEDSS